MSYNCVRIICYVNVNMNDTHDESVFNNIPVKCIKVNCNLKFEQLISKFRMVVGFNEQMGIECFYRMSIITNNNCKYILTPIRVMMMLKCCLILQN